MNATNSNRTQRQLHKRRRRRKKNETIAHPYKEPEVSNMVYNFSLGYPVNLDELAESGIHEAKYDKHKVSFLCLRKMPGIVIVFKTGKCIVSGIKSEEEMNQAVTTARRDIRPFSM